MAEPECSSSSMLPEPTLTFTLPSLHDALPLDCRVYHPHSLSASPRAPPWRKHAAIVAHPYAPLGGCYDDPVVDIVAGNLLRLGFLVGTFNFRGAHGSAGRTSWTAKAESADYMTVVGFVSHYVHFLDPFVPLTPGSPISRDYGNGPNGSPHVPQVTLSPPGSPSKRISPLPSPTFPNGTPGNDTPVLLLAGYSYGAMITTNLPPLESILAQFDTPACGSSAAEARLRAQHLAETQNVILASARAAVVDSQKRRSYRKSLGLRVGGDEDNRKSHDSKRSFSLDLEDRIHKGVTELKTKISHRKRLVSADQGAGEMVQEPISPNKATETVTPVAPEHLLPVQGHIAFHAAYLLISPLQGVVTSLATMSFPSPLGSISRRIPTRSFSWSATKNTPPSEELFPRRPALVEAESKLCANPTLAIYGDRDGFVAARKLRDWATRLQEVPNSKFRAHEVSGAGHFWVGSTALIMRDAIRTFAEGVLRDQVI
ncbi:hypothetical protein OQA88_1286 [Cercophora sp. LCS_1]